MTKQSKDYTKQERELYNALIDLNWSEPYIEMKHLNYAIGLTKQQLQPSIDSLVAKNKLLAGNEDIQGDIVVTYTPKVARGEAYGYPQDFFKHSEWQGFKL